MQRTTQKLIPLSGRGVIRLQGSTQKAFLQGLITQNLNFLTPQNSLYGALLTPQGRFYADFFLYEHQDSILLELSKELLEDVLATLKKYCLRHSVDLVDASEDWDQFVILGKGPQVDALNILPLRGVTKHQDNMIMSVDPRLDVLGIRVLKPANQTLSLTQFPEKSEADYVRFRYKVGVAEGTEMIVGKSVILEYGLKELHALSFDKGCYVGQELIARTTYRGAVNKHVFPCQVEGSGLEEQSVVVHDNQDVGKIVGCQNNFALALLKTSLVPAFEKKDFVLRSGEVRLKPYVTSWMMHFDA